MGQKSAYPSSFVILVEKVVFVWFNSGESSSMKRKRDEFASSRFNTPPPILEQPLVRSWNLFFFSDTMQGKHGLRLLTVQPEPDTTFSPDSNRSISQMARMRLK